MLPHCLALLSLFNLLVTAYFGQINDDDDDDDDVPMGRRSQAADLGLCKIFFYYTLCSFSTKTTLVSSVRLVKKGKGRYSSSWELPLRATVRHLPYGITQ